jgi:hypothetical protein
MDESVRSAEPTHGFQWLAQFAGQFSSASIGMPTEHVGFLKIMRDNTARKHAAYPQHARDPDQLLEKADLALYRVKNDGRSGFSFFTERMDAEAHKRALVVVDLRAAVPQSARRAAVPCCVEIWTKKHRYRGRLTSSMSATRFNFFSREAMLD